MDSAPQPNPHFHTAESWAAAREWLTFEPRTPGYTAGYALQSLLIFVRDHKMRDVPVGERTCEAHYGAFVLSQKSQDQTEARRLAVEVSYGRSPSPASVAGHEGRVYELGPEPDLDDIDGRPPAVVVWHDADLFYLIASDRLSSDVLMRVALSIYLDDGQQEPSSPHR